MKHERFIRGIISTLTATAAFATCAPLTITNISAENNVQAAEGSSLPNFISNGNFELPDIDKVTSSTTSGGKLYWRWDGGDMNTKTASFTFSGDNYTFYDVFPSEQKMSDWTTTPITRSVIYQKDSPWFTAQPQLFDKLIDATSDDDTASFGWQTTASNGMVELVDSTATQDQYFSENSNDAANGKQFAELAATEESSLYQSISSTPNTVLTWSLNHRARNGLSDTNDIMAVFVGPKQEGLKKSDKGSNDIFKQMAQLVLVNEDASSGADISRVSRTIYSVPVKDSMEITQDSVSLTPDDDHTEQWTCWLISDNDTAWKEYSGTYNVPTGQTETTLAFTAVRSATADETGVMYEGNCIDDVRFGVLTPFEMTVSGNGSGYVICAHNTNSGEVTQETPFSTNYEEDEKITIYAKANENAEFLGAYINGNFVGIGGDNGFKNDNETTYTYVHTMDTATNVQLVFADKQTNHTGQIIYDWNGGTVTGGTQDTYYLDELSGEHHVAAPKAPGNSNNKLLYWEFVTTDSEGKQIVERLTDDYTITYDKDNHKLTVTGQYVNEGTPEDITVTFEADQKPTIIMRAVYTRTLKIEAGTRYFGDEHVTHKDYTGGTITISGLEVDNNGLVDASYVERQVNPTTEFKITAQNNDGYTIESWFYSKGTEEMANTDIHYELTPTEMDKYQSKFYWNDDITIHVVFAENPQAPHLSAVGEDATSADTLKSNNITTAVLDDKNNNITTENVKGMYGGDQFGNTISTGFFKTVDLDGTANELKGVWTINLFSNNAFMKLADDTEYNTVKTMLGLGSSTAEKNEIVTDSTTVDKDAQGTIYGMPEGENASLQLKLYTGSNTTVSGDGSAIIGIVLDNIYAKESQAGFHLGADPGSAKDISKYGISSNQNNPYPAPTPVATESIQPEGQAVQPEESAGLADPVNSVDSVDSAPMTSEQPSVPEVQAID